MIAIWDNNQGYSAEEICFVDLGDGPETAKRLQLMETLGGGGSIVATAETLTWRDPEARMSFRAWFDRYAEHEKGCAPPYTGKTVQYACRCAHAVTYRELHPVPRPRPE